MALNRRDVAVRRHGRRVLRGVRAAGATLFVALCLVFFALSLRDEYDEGYELLSRLFFRTASARPPILVVAVLFGWAGVTHALTSRGLRVSRAVGGICEPRVVSRYALGLLDVILACRLVPFVAFVQRAR